MFIRRKSMRQFFLISVSFIIIASGNIFSQTAALESTLNLNNINGSIIPYQNGIPLPSFEKQKRSKINLSGDWKKKRFNADHNITLSARDENGYLNLINESPGYHLSSYDDSGWENKEIPSVENTMFEYPTVPEYYEDGVWYRVKFTVDDSLSGKFAKLIFYSVNYVADVWINDEYLGWHEGGYTPFAFDVSSAIKFGEENIVAVRVDNPPWGTRKDIIPFYKCDWFNYTGIIHDVYFEFTDPVSVIRADVIPQNIDGEFESKITIYNSTDHDQSITAQIQVYEADVNELNIISEYAEDLASEIADFTGESEYSFTINSNSALVWKPTLNVTNPKLWSPQNPDLYVLKLTLLNQGNIIDEYFTQFGLRTIRTEGNKVLLNGNIMFLTGAARHEDHPVYGRSIPKEIIFDDMMLIDSSNINYLRTAHYPNNPYTYLIADRLGITMMEEIPVWWFDNEEEWLIQNNERHIHEQMFREMVFKDYNRPSILFWSTSNECKEETNRIIYNQRVADDLRNNYNDGRLITQSSAGDIPGSGDITQGPLDVAGWTLYFGIFHGSTYFVGTIVFLNQASAAHPGKPIIDTEFGYWSSENNSTLDEQVTVFDETFRAFKCFSPLKTDGTLNSNGFLIGTTWWCVFDWYSHGHPHGYQSMGLISMDRQIKKPVYYTLKENYAIYYSYGGMVITDLKSETINNIQNSYSLKQNFPNPFNSSTTIEFSILQPSTVTLTLYNILGQKVMLIFSGKLGSGPHKKILNSDNLLSGIYYYELRVNKNRLIKKCIILK